MTKLKGGYILIDLTSSTLGVDLRKALLSGKPVLMYDNNGKPSFYTIELTEDDNYILKTSNGGYSISYNGQTITPIDSSSSIKTHYIIAKFLDTCSDEHNVLIVIEDDGSITYDSHTSIAYAITKFGYQYDEGNECYVYDRCIAINPSSPESTPVCYDLQNDAYKLYLDSGNWVTCSAIVSETIK